MLCRLIPVSSLPPHTALLVSCRLSNGGDVHAIDCKSRSLGRAAIELGSLECQALILNSGPARPL